MTSNPTFLATGSSSLSLTSRGFSPSSSLSLGVRIPARLSPAEGCSDGPGRALSAPDAHPFSPSSLVSSCPLCAAGVPTPSGLGFAAEPSAPPPHRGRKGSSSARGVRRCIAGARGLPSASAAPPPPVTAGGTLLREALQPAPAPCLLPGRRFHPPPLCPLDPERRRYQEFLLHSRWDLSKVTGLSRLEMSSFFLLSSRRRLYNGGRCEATFPAPHTDLIMPGVSRASLSEATLPHRLSQPQGIL